MNPILLAYALKMVGLPYIYGGNTPVLGFDCSGLTLELLKAQGKFPIMKDTNAQGLYIYLKGEGYKPTKDPEAGDIIFFGKSVLDIGHVAFCLGNGMMIEAAGGDSTTLTKEKAIEKNAFVKIRPISYRKDILITLSEF